jgi:hypothetical protein
MARARQSIERFVIFVPVPCEHTENLDVHPGLTSSHAVSCKRGLIHETASLFPVKQNIKNRFALL